VLSEARKDAVDFSPVERPGSRLRLVVSYAVVAAVSLAADGCTDRLHPNTRPAGKPPAGEQPFTATAYCTGSVTATGTTPTEKTVAADPDVLPIGSRIRLTGLDKRYNRTYVVMDTGANIRGRRIDLYMRDCREAVAFGRRSAKVSILR
jgi:3D (Asp-Asp-Asp) domain-containing protein